MDFERRVIEYRSFQTTRLCRHHVLMVRDGGKLILLSHANLFLNSSCAASIETSGRYSSVIVMFYRFLSTQDKFAEIAVGRYHVLTDNSDIKRWQVTRQISRVQAQTASPSSHTIFEDAKIILVFFRWLIDAGYSTCVNVKVRSWYPNFKTERMVNYIQDTARVSIDFRNIEVLDYEVRQRQRKALITDNEIKQLIESFSDPVYSTLFKLALGTAMRPMDLCKFPYIGNGKNRHILPYSSMGNRDEKVVDYTVELSKGKKSRTIKINRNDLRMLENDYIRPFYAERAQKYEENFGRKCPPSVLFLNKFGYPINQKMIASRTNDAKKVAVLNNPEFRQTVKFYDARHWWPTMYLINFFKDELLTESADALNLAVGQVLLDQLGHSHLATTYKYYIDMARLVLLAYKGSVQELLTEPVETVQQFVHRVTELETQTGC
jgi:integrase